MNDELITSRDGPSPGGLSDELVTPKNGSGLSCKLLPLVGLKMNRLPQGMALVLVGGSCLMRISYAKRWMWSWLDNPPSCGLVTPRDGSSPGWTTCSCRFVTSTDGSSIGWRSLPLADWLFQEMDLFLVSHSNALSIGYSKR